MKNLTVIVSLCLCIALTNNVIAMGFPHNLLAGKKGLKKERIIMYPNFRTLFIIKELLTLS